MTDKTHREAKWQANERELNRLNFLSPLSREQFAARIDQLEAEQDAFDAEDCVWSYRYAHSRKDTAECQRLRTAWHELQGEDSLHEMAFSRPTDQKSIDRRTHRLIDRHHRTLCRWPATLCEFTQNDSGNVIRRTCVFGDPESADTRKAQAISKEARAIKKELWWVMKNGSNFLPKDSAE